MLDKVLVKYLNKILFLKTKASRYLIVITLYASNNIFKPEVYIL